MSRLTTGWWAIFNSTYLQMCLCHLHTTMNLVPYFFVEFAFSKSCVRDSEFELFAIIAGCILLVLWDTSEESPMFETSIVVLYTLYIWLDKSHLILLTRIREREREMFYLTTHSTHFIYGYMVKDHSDSEKGNPLPPHRLLLSINSKGSFICTIPQIG